MSVGEGEDCGVCVGGGGGKKRGKGQGEISTEKSRTTLAGTREREADVRPANNESF